MRQFNNVDILYYKRKTHLRKNLLFASVLHFIVSIAVSACNSGQFSQLQLCPYNYTNCSDSGLAALDNVTYLFLCQPGYAAIGNISTQYFYSELCAPPTSAQANGTSSANAIQTVTTPPDTDFTPVMIALFSVTIALGLVAIAAVALNVLLTLKTVNVNTETNGKHDLSKGQQPAPLLGMALIERPNTLESTYAVVEK